MDLSVWIEDPFFLQIAKDVLFCGLFYLSGAYLIPRGIFFLHEWKSPKDKNKLATGVMFFAAGVFLLLYLLAAAIIAHIRTVYK